MIGRRLMGADGSMSFDFSELIVDSFAGGGGASTGIERALGRAVDIAVNHDEQALAMHAANHPDTLHLREDVWAVNPRAALGRRQIGLLWASPDCKHFSKAKGGKPVSKRIRGLAWVVCKWASGTRPRVIMLENVEEFQDWGPLKQVDGQWLPDLERKGITFQRFIARLRNLGYKVEWKQLRACDYGAPTIRKRLFVIARRDGLPIVWPKPTHGPGLLPYRTAADCIDWSIPCPSIFERKKPLAEATMRRIARGVMRYVVNAQQPFIVPIANYGRGLRVNAIAEPLSTVTANPKGGSHALVVPHITKFRTNSTGHGCDEPMHTVTASSHVVRPGGAAPLGLVTATMVQTGYGERPTLWACSHCRAEYSAGEVPVCGCTQCGAEDDLVRVPGQAPRALDIEKPLGTVVADQKHAVVTAFLAQHNNHRGTEPSTGRAITLPLSTLTTNGSQQQLVTASLANDVSVHAGEVRAFLIKYYGTDQDPRLEEPLHTISTKDRFGLVVVRGELYRIVDIGMRMLTPRELANAQGFPPEYIIDRGADGRVLTKAAQVRMIGNSVCPPLSEALVRANFAHELKNRRAA